MGLHVLGAEMTLSSEHHLHVLGGGIENRWEVGRSHDGRLISILLEDGVKGRISIGGGCLDGNEERATKRSKIEAHESRNFAYFGILGAVVSLCVTKK